MNNYLNFSKELAEEAGKIMLKYYKNRQLGTQLKGDRTPVTMADSQINGMVIEKVRQQFPTHGVVGEEASHFSDSEYNWVCDPIDGTYAFTYGIPIFTFNLALVQKGKPQVAVQYDPSQDRLYTAVKDKGTYLNGKQLKITGDFVGRLPINLEIYRSSMFEDDFVEGESTLLLSDDNFLIYKFVAIAYSAGLVASGEFAAAIFSGYTPYEAATCSLLVTEAGGKFTDLFGKPIEEYDANINGFIAAPPAIHSILLNRLRPALKKAKLKEIR